MSALRGRSAEIAGIVDAACARLPWYRSLIIASAYPANRNPEDLPRITEEILLANYYRSAALPGADERAYLTSGTATGRRKRILWSGRDHVAYVDHRTSILRPFLAGCRRACADLGTGHAAASALEVFERLGLESSSIDFTLPLERHLEILNQTQPDVLFTMPMILDRILASNALRAPLRKIIVLGDTAPSAWCRNVARRLAIAPSDVLDLYGSIEVGSIAYFDHAKGRYCFEPHIVPEVEPSPHGEVLLLTSLAREAFPAIRFCTGDLIEGFAHGAEGNSFRSISGRASDDLKHGEKISVHSIVDAIHSVLDAADFEIRRQDRGIVLQIAAAGFSERAGRLIVKRIRAGNPDVDQMIRSGMIADIEVRAMPRDCVSAGAKRRIVRAEE